MVHLYELSSAMSISHIADHFLFIEKQKQILLEPGVIQDVLAAGSHLQLLELLNLCSHYLIQVRVLTSANCPSGSLALKL